MSDRTASDVLVLGGGPGGYAAAFLAADKGLKVTLVDAAARPGGTCLHVGCIPSKTLLHVARVLAEARDLAQFGVRFETPRIDLDTLRTHTQSIIDTMSRNLLDLCGRRKVEFVAATATFVDAHTVKLSDGSERHFEHCIIAVGSSPTIPPALALESPLVMDSTAALRLDEVPGSLLVVGGGYIGLELGSVYAALGSRVTLVELTGALLPNVDPDLVRPLQSRLATSFEAIHVNTGVTRLIPIEGGIHAELDGAGAATSPTEFDRVLLALGRRPNSGALGLEHTAIKRDERGFIQVDDQRRTAEAHIYAIGDVAGEPMLAHKASHEGRVAVEAILGEPAVFDQVVPAVVFTDPEIAWCGLTEQAAKRSGQEVTVVRFPWAASGRAATLGRSEGLTKLVLDPKTERILGVGMVGVGAGELIAEGVLAVEMAATARDLTLTIHPHPTLSETVAEAAESLFGTATHVYKPRR